MFCAFMFLLCVLHVPALLTVTGGRLGECGPAHDVAPCYVIFSRSSCDSFSYRCKHYLQHFVLEALSRVKRRKNSFSTWCRRLLRSGHKALSGLLRFTESGPGNLDVPTWSPLGALTASPKVPPGPVRPGPARPSPQ
jgi:hypothetical protein